MPKRTKGYRAGLLEDLRDQVEATCYLRAAAEDSPEMLLIALRDVAEARQMSKVAADAGVQRESLYRMLSETGNPRYSSLYAVLAALGYKLTVEPLDQDDDVSPSPSRGENATALDRVRGAAADATNEEDMSSHALFLGSLVGHMKMPAGSVKRLGVSAREPEISSRHVSGQDWIEERLLPNLTPFNPIQTRIEVHT
jgi:probable addiction module antidote protein